MLHIFHSVLLHSRDYCSHTKTYDFYLKLDLFVSVSPHCAHQFRPKTRIFQCCKLFLRTYQTYVLLYLVPEHAPEDLWVRRHTRKHCAVASLLQTRWPPERIKFSLFQFANQRTFILKRLKNEIRAHSLTKSMPRGPITQFSVEMFVHCS